MYDRNTEHLDRDLKNIYERDVYMGCKISQGEANYRIAVINAEQKRRDFIRGALEVAEQKQKELFTMLKKQ